MTRLTGSLFAASEVEEVEEIDAVEAVEAAVAADVVELDPTLPTATQEPKGPARAGLRQRTRQASPLGPPVQLTPLEETSN